MPNQIQSYQKVIEVIADINFDHDARAILLQIAKTNPQVVVDASSFLKGNEGNYHYLGIPQEVFNLLLAGRKIEAIKQHRLETGLGLKEAKDAVEEAISKHSSLRGVFSRKGY